MDSKPMDAGRMVGLLSLVWFLTGMLVFFGFALVAFTISPFATDNIFQPEGYWVAVLIWHLPMVWGWFPAALRSIRKRPAPWRGAKRTILLGVCIGPALFLAAMLALRIVMQASASV